MSDDIILTQFLETLRDRRKRRRIGLPEWATVPLERPDHHPDGFLAWLRRGLRNIEIDDLIDRAAREAAVDLPAACFLLVALLERLRLLHRMRSPERRRLVRRVIAGLSREFGARIEIERVIAWVHPSVADPPVTRKLAGLLAQRPPRARPPDPLRVVGPPVLGQLPEFSGPGPGDDEASQAAAYAALAEPVNRVAMPAMEPLATTLKRRFPWLAGSIDDLLRPVAFAMRLGQPFFRLPPVLLVGPPGAGKSALAIALGEAARVPLGLCQAGASFEAGRFGGTPRGWRSAQPSEPLRLIRGYGVANPIIVVDELDKSALGQDTHGRIVDALLGMLEPATAVRWVDPFLQVPCDLSGVSWMVIANDADRLPPALRSRMSTIHIPGPTGVHANGLIDWVRADLAQGHGRSLDLIPDLDPDSRAAIASDLDRTGDLRRLHRAVVSGLAQSDWTSVH